MGDMSGLMDIICTELEKIEKKGLNTGNLDTAYKLVDMYKDLMMADGGQSEYSQARYARDGYSGGYGSYADGNSMDGYAGRGYARDSYADGNSYARRGQHYVRGHYSRDGYSMDGKNRMENCKMEMMDALDMIERNADDADKRKIREYRKAIERVVSNKL